LGLSPCSGRTTLAEPFPFLVLGGKKKKKKKVSCHLSLLFSSLLTFFNESIVFGPPDSKILAGGGLHYRNAISGPFNLS